MDPNVLEMLGAIDRAGSIFQLRTYLKPGTALGILKGSRKGQISLRDNSQYHLCFYWVSGEGAYNIELVDYHR
jgi:proteic killer suppression protein